jgi:hypothetical protein
MIKIISLLLIVFVINFGSHAVELNCSKLPDKQKPKCLPIYCKKDLKPLKAGEVIITLGKRSMARIIGNEWKSTFDGKELNLVNALYSTQNQKKFDIEPIFDYDVLQDTCFTYARPKESSLSDEHLYSSNADVKFNIELTKEYKKLLQTKLPSSENLKLHIYGVSDINKNGIPEVWYRTGLPSCFQLEVLELTSIPSAKLLVFPFSYECGE